MGLALRAVNFINPVLFSKHLISDILMSSFTDIHCSIEYYDGVDMMSALQAAVAILKEANAPLHYKEITRRMIDSGLWQTNGKTPERTVSSEITKNIELKGDNALFQRINEGVYALRSGEISQSQGQSEAVDRGDDTPQMAFDTSSAKFVSFTDAAEQVLKQYSNGKPMHYREITSKALALNLIKTKGLTPEATLYSQILSEIRRNDRKGTTPRFVMQKGGFVGLSRWHSTESDGLILQIEQHNQRARKQIHGRLFSMSPKEFEELVGQLLVALGFENVIVTDYSKDGGIDVRGTLVVGDVIRVNMAVQVKRWKANVPAPEVQRVRGSLGTHDQGLIITTSDFSEGAIEEARRPNAVPVALMNGSQLVTLLVEHSIGVYRRSYGLIELGETDE